MKKLQLLQILMLLSMTVFPVGQVYGFGSWLNNASDAAYSQQVNNSLSTLGTLQYYENSTPEERQAERDKLAEERADLLYQQDNDIYTYHCLGGGGSAANSGHARCQDERSPEEKNMDYISSDKFYETVDVPSEEEYAKILEENGGSSEAYMNSLPEDMQEEVKRINEGFFGEGNVDDGKIFDTGASDGSEQKQSNNAANKEEGPKPCTFDSFGLADCLKPANAPDFDNVFTGGSTTDNVKQLLGLIAGGIAALAGTAAILFIVIHGLRLATAGADEGRRTEAIKGLQWTILGLIGVIFAYVIVSVLIDVVTTVGAPETANPTTQQQQDSATTPDSNANTNQETTNNEGTNTSANSSEGEVSDLDAAANRVQAIIDRYDAEEQQAPLVHGQEDNGMTYTRSSEPAGPPNNLQ